MCCLMYCHEQGTTHVFIVCSRCGRLCVVVRTGLLWMFGVVRVLAKCALSPPPGTGDAVTPAQAQKPAARSHVTSRATTSYTSQLPCFTSERVSSLSDSVAAASEEVCYCCPCCRRSGCVLRGEAAAHYCVYAWAAAASRTELCISATQV